MSEWWTYALSDFLLFSPRAYYRLFVLYNESVWPAHALALAFAALCLVLARIAAGRVILGILAMLWLWIAVAFHAERFATINWAAVYYAYGFTLQAALLLWYALVVPRVELEWSDLLSSFTGGTGLALFAFAVVLQPAIGPLLGRDPRGAEIFGLAPDPTVVATLGLLCLSTRIPWPLFPIPLLWCAMTGLTLWTMEAPDALVTPVAGALALVAAAWKTVVGKSNRAA